MTEIPKNDLFAWLSKGKRWLKLVQLSLNPKFLGATMMLRRQKVAQVFFHVFLSNQGTYRAPQQSGWETGDRRDVGGVASSIALFEPIKEGKRDLGQD